MLVEVASEFQGFIVAGFGLGIAMSVAGVLLRGILGCFSWSLSDGDQKGF